MSWAPVGMGKRRHLLSPGKCTRLDSLKLQHFGSRRKYHNRCHKASFTGSKCTQIAIAVGALPPDPAGGAYSVPTVTDPLAALKGFASQQRRKCRVDMAGEGRGREELRDGKGRGKGGGRLAIIPSSAMPLVKASNKTGLSGQNGDCQVNQSLDLGNDKRWTDN